MLPSIVTSRILAPKRIPRLAGLLVRGPRCFLLQAFVRGLLRQRAFILGPSIIPFILGFVEVCPGQVSVKGIGKVSLKITEEPFSQMSIRPAQIIEEIGIGAVDLCGFFKLLNGLRKPRTGVMGVTEI